MKVEFLDNPLLTRPQLIKLTGSKMLVDTATHSGALPHIRIGKDGSKRPRHLYRRADVDKWLEELSNGKVQE